MSLIFPPCKCVKCFDVFIYFTSRAGGRWPALYWTYSWTLRLTQAARLQLMRRLVCYVHLFKRTSSTPTAGLPFNIAVPLIWSEHSSSLTEGSRVRRAAHALISFRKISGGSEGHGAFINTDEGLVRGAGRGTVDTDVQPENADQRCESRNTQSREREEYRRRNRELISGENKHV